eukprot:CAMPEP_0116932666 /NCGR_PEP_ID=MMETSP0467-20121206/28577_1 /TAXON_ID=283647 /ORGANISM="Mesodinium pulex, Strain SPMC105" /LENGTH=126 /DNA_ID=CAMNT_0004613399 /DNA_START=725 /DNA_END=1105 /DNA_ORIENTATION=-
MSGINKFRYETDQDVQHNIEEQVAHQMEADTGVKKMSLKKVDHRMSMEDLKKSVVEQDIHNFRNYSEKCRQNYRRVFNTDKNIFVETEQETLKRTESKKQKVEDMDLDKPDIKSDWNWNYASPRID